MVSQYYDVCVLKFHQRSDLYGHALFPGSRIASDWLLLQSGRFSTFSKAHKNVTGKLPMKTEIDYRVIFVRDFGELRITGTEICNVRQIYVKHFVGEKKTIFTKTLF